MTTGSTGEVTSANAFSYHLRIGVTGHRNLTQTAEITKAVDGFLEYVNATVQPQSRTPLEWTVISPLAKGADRIVAAAVLNRHPSHLEFRSPLSLEEYRRDFESGVDRDEFEQLLERADSVECTTQGEPPADADDAERLAWRNRAYLKVGRSVVDACEILLVVWNGQPARGLGGTGDVVAYALGQQRTVIWIHANEPSRTPCRIIEWTPGSPPKTKDLPTAAKELSLGYHQLDAYNRDDCVSSGDLAETTRGLSQSLRERAQKAGVDAATIGPIVEAVAPHCARADRLAVYYQNRYVWAMASLFLLSAIAVTVGVGQILFFPSAVWLILFEILAMGLAVGLWLWSKQSAWHEKWIHDRYLAERLRIALFSLVLNSPDADRRVSPSKALAFYSGPRHWLLSVVQDAVDRARLARPAPAELKAVKRFLIDAWFGSQQQYHAANAHRKKSAVHLGHRTGIVLFLVTLVMAILHLAGVGHPEGGHHAEGIGRLDAWITFLAIVLPVWGAALHAITNQLELERIAARSERMAAILRLLVERTGEAETLDEMREIAIEGESVMGAENHEWWILLSFREPVLPA